MTTDPVPTPLAALVNAPEVFDVGGRSYRFGELDLLQIARFETWLENRALALGAKLSENMPPTIRDGVLNQIVQGVAAGEYQWGGVACLRAIQTREGMTQLVYLAVQMDDPTFTLEQAREVCDGLLQAKLERAMLVKVAPDPKD